MSRDTGLLVDLEEDLGISNLATKNDQRTCASFCHLEALAGFCSTANILVYKKRGRKTYTSKCNNYIIMYNSIYCLYVIINVQKYFILYMSMKYGI